jgi:transposase
MTYHFYEEIPLFMLFGERALRHALKEYVEHYNYASYCLTSLCRLAPAIAPDNSLASFGPIHTTEVAAEAKYDGTFVLTTTDETLDAEDVALGYKSMMLIEGGFRRMKTTGLQTRPIYYWRPHRTIVHVKLCVLALLLERAAEIRCQQTWRTIRQPLDQWQVVRYRMQGETIVQSTQMTSTLAEILRSLRIPTPQQSLSV